ncbi:hypothetical protein [Streptomyces mirabilis]|uniref:Uncharacterized protein n=1 Tax=Streptomyces mirabilis TaxID=68239 RepID=A0ABU3V554_9ACTN|nr:hypothetical protein [Streptomyces mirabilis]MCX5355645.1 hypothetical protein [Streptomyces mirabilis]MDU9001291.1 hypothetical protein [Streptomyces mirabilis]
MTSKAGDECRSNCHRREGISIRPGLRCKNLSFRQLTHHSFHVDAETHELSGRLTVGEYSLDLVEPEGDIVVVIQSAPGSKKPARDWSHQFMLAEGFFFQAALGRRLGRCLPLGEQNRFRRTAHRQARVRGIGKGCGTQPQRLVVCSAGGPDGKREGKLGPLHLCCSGVLNCSRLVNICLLAQVLPQADAVKRGSTPRGSGLQCTSVSLQVQKRPEQFFIGWHTPDVLVLGLLVQLPQLANDCSRIEMPDPNRGFEQGLYRILRSAR